MPGAEASAFGSSPFPGRWRIGFQRYNPGVEMFWSTAATQVSGTTWEIHDGPAAEARPPDALISFTTSESFRNDRS